jgi:hypothetical protein
VLYQIVSDGFAFFRIVMFKSFLRMRKFSDGPVAIQNGDLLAPRRQVRSLMSRSGNGRKSLAFRRSLQVDDPLAPPAEAGGLQSR